MLAESLRHYLGDLSGDDDAIILLDVPGTTYAVHSLRQAGPAIAVIVAGPAVHMGDISSPNGGDPR